MIHGSIHVWMYRLHTMHSSRIHAHANKHVSVSQLAAADEKLVKDEKIKAEVADMKVQAAEEEAKHAEKALAEKEAAEEAEKEKKKLENPVNVKVWPFSHHGHACR
jgi:hypothetical protein